MHFNLSETNNKYSELSELQKCSLPNWYNKFEKISVKTYFVNIPNDVVNYLKDDIILLPKECYTNDSTNEEFGTATDFGPIPESDNESDEDDDVNVNISQEPEFLQFSNIIAETIAKFNNKCCFLKTNWHSPKDSYWITVGQTLKVKDITDVYQLLKASNIVRLDLNYHNLTIPDEIQSSSVQQSAESNFYLVFKKWLEIHPGTEFRCFVKNNKLIAVSPRDWPQYHEHIDDHKFEIVSDILSIFKEKIQNQFGLTNYCFDVVRDVKDHVILLDFSPFNSKLTESLAFEWDEFETNYFNDIEEPEFRYINENCYIQPNCRNNYGYPQDIIDVFQSNPDSNSSLTDLLINRLRNNMFIEEYETEEE